MLETIKTDNFLYVNIDESIVRDYKQQYLISKDIKYIDANRYQLNKISRINT